jgi:hypothetical protein
MTPLEAARRLAEENEPQLETMWQIEGVNMRGRAPNMYRFCHKNVGQGHAPDCPWLALPRIVAALEAAERVADARFAAWCAHADVITDLVDALRDEVPSP